MMSARPPEGLVRHDPSAARPRSARSSRGRALSSARTGAQRSRPRVACWCRTPDTGSPRHGSGIGCRGRRIDTGAQGWLAPSHGLAPRATPRTRRCPGALAWACPGAGWRPVGWDRWWSYRAPGEEFRQALRPASPHHPPQPGGPSHGWHPHGPAMDHSPLLALPSGGPRSHDYPPPTRRSMCRARSRSSVGR